MSQVTCPDCGGAGGLFISRCERCSGSGKVEAYGPLKASGVCPVPMDPALMIDMPEFRAAMHRYGFVTLNLNLGPLVALDDDGNPIGDDDDDS